MKKTLVSLFVLAPAFAGVAQATAFDNYLSTKDTYAFATIGSADNILASGLHYAAGVGVPLKSHDNISIEASAGMYGDQTNGVLTYSVSHFGAAAVYNLPVAGIDRLTGFAKVGLNYVSEKSSSAAFSSTTSGISLSYGIGAQYEINEKFDVRAQYENLGGSFVTYGSLNAGVVYHFE